MVAVFLEEVMYPSRIFRSGFTPAFVAAITACTVQPAVYSPPPPAPVVYAPAPTAYVAAPAAAITGAYPPIVVTVQTAPPPLPVYEQPPAPAEGYIWTPGCWHSGVSGYFWVPGTWVQPPQ